MFNLGAGEITVILLLALIFLGPKQLPELASKLGKVIRDIRKAASDVKNEITLDESFRKPFEDLRDAVTLHPDELRRRDEIQKAVEEAKKRAADAEAEMANAKVDAKADATTPPPIAAAPGVSPTPSVEPPPAAPLAGVQPSFVPPVAPPTGTVAATGRNVPRGGSAATPAEENVPASVPAGDESAPFSPADRAAPAAVLTSAPPPAPPPASGPRVTPPVSSVESERANATQTLSEADILASAPPPRRPPTPPPLPGLDRNPPPQNRMGMPRVTPPISSLSGDRANATQTLSETDLLPPGAGKPPPVPGSKKA